MPNYTIWNMHGLVGVNVPQENDDDVDMPDVAIHDVDEEPGVNTKPMAIVNNVFRNMLADDTEDNDGISQLLRNV
jgi:DNA primase